MLSYHISIYQTTLPALYDIKNKQYLHHYGGDFMTRFGLIGENTIELIELILNIWKNGNCVVLIDKKMPPKAIINLLKDSKVSTCYIDKDLIGKFPYENEDIKFIGFNTCSFLPTYLPDRFYCEYDNNTWDLESEAVILFSSGTTGDAKGVILSHLAIRANVEAIIDYIKPTDKDCFGIIKPLSHASTLIGELVVALYKKIPLLVFPAIITPLFVIKNLKVFSISILCMSPTLLTLFIKTITNYSLDFYPLRVIYVSGSILSLELISTARKLFKGISVYNMYGLTEAGPRVTAQMANFCNGNSVGHPIKGVNVKILNDNTFCDSKFGRIYVKTPSLFNGYISGEKKLNCEGWLDTGDIGYIDENNEVWIVGRSDSMILHQSHNIYPETIEQVILTYYDIYMCHVQLLKGDLVCKYSTFSQKELSFQEVVMLRKQLISQLSAYEVPTKFIFVKNIKTSSTGKVKRHEEVRHDKYKDD